MIDIYILMCLYSDGGQYTGKFFTYEQADKEANILESGNLSHCSIEKEVVPIDLENE